MTTLQPVPEFYQVLRVFIACPGDLSPERSRFQKILETVNTLRAHAMGFHLEAVGWERVVPALGRPQELINKELESSHLVVVMFWNRLGSLSGRGDLTGTMEELEIAKRMCGFDESEHRASGRQRPALYVYFKQQTIQSAEADAVAVVRTTLETSKKILFRSYSDVSEWEELLLHHLIAFLNGRTRTPIEQAIQTLPPPDPTLIGRFVWQEEYSGGILSVEEDFDRDRSDETVSFYFQQVGYRMTFEKDGAGHEASFRPEFLEALDDAASIHLALKDVNNDGFPELLIAANSRLAQCHLSV